MSTVFRYPPMQASRITTDTAIASPYYGGIQITAKATATVVFMRHGQTGASPILFRYEVPATTTLLFPLPGPVHVPDMIFVDVDANTEEATVLYW